MEKTHWKKVFNSEFLGSCDLEEGKSLKCVIKSVSIRKVKGNDGKDQERNVAEFTDPKIKPMVLNSTNCKVVKKFAKSPYINDWNNIPVEIYAKELRAFGEETEGLRIKETQPIFQKPPLTPNMPAWNKVVEAYKKEQNFARPESVYFISEENKALIKLQSNGN